ncbi:hypothetical protein E4U25_004216 [Claviceps purpurea]|nr:hypothetical protein E4U10_001384 [Claviceps purpurea]KAG6235969.1 hypothetical protein E4U25_004216 [Claviceps purpurea]
MSAKAPITCHVLDTTTGRPATAIRVRLRGGTIPGQVFNFETSTDQDGRISTWPPCSSPASSSGSNTTQTLGDVLGQPDGKDASTWILCFDTAGYFGMENTFFPEVVVSFRVKRGERYHVPLLLGPFSYTTYRGS